VDEGLAELDAAGRLADGDASALLRHAVNASDALNSVGRYEDAVRIAEAGASEARRRGVERTSGVMLSSNTAEPLLALGRLDRSAELLDAALALDAPPSFRAQLQRNKLWLTLWRGDVDRAEELLRRWRGSLRILGELEMQARLSIARITGEIALARGDADQAWREVGGIGAAPFASIPGYDLPVLAVAARALAERAVARRAGGGGADGSADPQTLDRTQPLDVQAEALRLETVLAALGDWPTFPVWAPLVEAELASARAADAVSDTERARRSALAVEAWSSAVEAARSPLAPAHLHPYALLRAARAALAAGDRPAAERLAAQAREEADRFGFGLVAASAAALVAHRGPRAVAGAGGGGGAVGAPLTEREEQVLALIEQGLSNKQIGERLFISAKTASVHVSSILRKTGAATRTEAVYRAARASR
jgi:ATP/maltotriose-dependent transcriptional regulator MalT